MKVRNGFVSNSSSSSFILAYKKEKSCDTDFALLFKSIKSSGYEDTTLFKEKTEEIIEELKLLEKTELIKKIEDFCKNNKNWKIISCMVDHSDKLIIEIINKMKDDGFLVILYSEIH